jgi:hypothetical protein
VHVHYLCRFVARARVDVALKSNCCLSTTRWANLFRMYGNGWHGQPPVCIVAVWMADGRCHVILICDHLYLLLTNKALQCLLAMWPTFCVGVAFLL